MWIALGAPQTIIEVLSGYRIPFIRKPPLCFLSPAKGKKFEPKPSTSMSAQISNLIKLGVITPNKYEYGFLSPIFLRDKPDGSHRLIFNLKNLNEFVYPQKFRLISLKKVAQIMSEREFMVKIDISNAYYHVPVRESHKRFLCLSYKNQIYTMNCLPFGLSSAPSIFAKITNWIASSLREKGIKVVVYLDDFLLMHQNADILTNQANWVYKFLSELGWHININKSDLTPRTKIEYLGIIWDTQLNQKKLPQSKVSNINNEISHILRKNNWTWVDAKKLIGKLIFASNAIPLGLLNCRFTQVASRRLPEHRKFKAFPLPATVIKELQWWLENLTKSSIIKTAPPNAFLTTDASDTGWGAVINDKKLSGKWESYQNSWHCNRKELWTLLAVLQAELADLCGKTIIFQTDNRTAASYIRKEGGTKSIHLLRTASEILNIAHQNQITIIPRYLPGRYNGIADRLSRQKQQQEWHLSPFIRNIIFKTFGTPEIDLFASSRSAVVTRYVSEDSKDTNSEYTNAFSKPWAHKLAWIFPPPALIPRVLQHLQSSQGQYLLVIPKWEKAFWKPEVKKRAVAPPFRIKNLKAHLVDLHTLRPPPDINNLSLEVWRIRAGPLKYKIGQP